MDYNTQDTRSFDSYLSSTNQEETAKGGVDYFTVLPCWETIRRSTQFAATFMVPRFVPWTAVCMAPSLVVAVLTAVVHTTPQQQQQLDRTSTPLDQIRQALPLVVWHVLVLGIGAMLAQCVVVRFLAEFYGQSSSYTSLSASLRTTTWQHGATLAAAGIFVTVSLAVTYLVGHGMTAGLVDLRHDAVQARDKDPWVFGTIAAACLIIMLVVDGFVVFAVIWMTAMYSTTIPIVLLQRPDSPIEIFRQAYVLARDSRSYLCLSWALALLPLVVTSCLVTLPWQVATRATGQDYVEWQLGTVSGILALYLPVTLVWLPVMSIHQTVLYMTLRVVKDGLTLEILKGELDRAKPTYAMVGSNANGTSNDTVPLALGPSGSHDFDCDDDIPEDELDSGKDIELPETSNE